MNWDAVRTEVRNGLSEIGGSFTFYRTVFRGALDESTGQYAPDTVAQFDLIGVRGAGDASMRFKIGSGLDLTVAKQFDLVVVADRALVVGDQVDVDGVRRTIAEVATEQPFNVPLIHSVRLTS